MRSHHFVAGGGEFVRSLRDAKRAVRSGHVTGDILQDLAKAFRGGVHSIRGLPPEKKPWITREGPPAWCGWIGPGEGAMGAQPSQVRARSPVIPPATAPVASDAEDPASCLGDGRNDVATPGDDRREAQLGLHRQTRGVLT